MRCLAILHQEVIDINGRKGMLELALILTNLFYLAPLVAFLPRWRAVSAP